MFFGTLNYGESPYVIYLWCLEPFMLVFHDKNDSLEEYSLATSLPVLSPNITQFNLVFIFFLWSRTP